MLFTHFKLHYIHKTNDNFSKNKITLRHYFFHKQSETNPCDPNPCLHGGTCMESTTESNDFKCDCQGTGYQGSTCERGIVFTPRIPSLTKDEQNTFEIAAYPDTELTVKIESSFARALNVTPRSITFTRRNNISQFSVEGFFAGQYALQYILSGFEAVNFESPEESPVFVRQPRSEKKPTNAYYDAVRNEPGVLK